VPASLLRSATTRRAYTLIELIIVIALLGLAGSMLVPQIVGRHSMVAQAAVRKIISDLSFAQSDALSHQEFRRVHFYDDGSGYCIVRVTDETFDDDFDADTADYVIDPLSPGGDASSYIVDFVADDRFEGVSISAVAIDGGAEFITFDQLGGTVMDGSAPGVGGSFVVSAADASYKINIAPFTGKLTVEKVE
jgi:prepilin-type N-terminal cleavage/methylation domain-containing protein